MRKSLEILTSILISLTIVGILALALWMREYHNELGKIILSYVRVILGVGVVTVIVHTFLFEMVEWRRQ